MTVQFVQGVYIDTYDPTIEDSYSKEIEVDGRACNLEILDTAGVAQFTAMRELYIKNGQGFLLVYSVTDKNSLQELLAIREQIIRIKGTNNIPMVLVGNKCDLTEERELEPEDGIDVSKQWNKVPFYETSAMYRMNVEDVFVDVIRQIIRKEVQQQQNSDKSATEIQESREQTNQAPLIAQNTGLKASPAPAKTAPPVVKPTNIQRPQAPRPSQTKTSTPPKKQKKSKCVIL